MKMIHRYQDKMCFQFAEFNGIKSSDHQHIINEDYFIKFLCPPNNSLKFRNLNKKLNILGIELCRLCYLFSSDLKFSKNN